MIDLLLGVEMADIDGHRKKLANLCRFCGSSALKKSKGAKTNFKDNCERYFCINVEDDNDFTHFTRYFYRLQSRQLRLPLKFIFMRPPQE